jgi:hypothetical protein
MVGKRSESRRSGSFTAFRMTAAFLIGIFLYAKFRPGAPLFLREGPALTRCPALWSTWHRRHAEDAHYRDDSRYSNYWAQLQFGRMRDATLDLKSEADSASSTQTTSRDAVGGF